MPEADPVRRLIERGVVMPHAASVEVDPAIAPEHIAPGVIIHAGCRLRGATTSMGPGCEIGEEGPATVEDCQLGANVSLKGGAFSGAVFLDGSNFGSGAHVRPGTILEEEANCAHTAGLKQTVLLPFVTGGSLINFCDVLMAGGTHRKNHSEIGSSYIHFNFTPHGDKATASLLGDVPFGVMLDQPPIFLGGQGGLVGPCRIEFGCVIPAGMICRHDALTRGHLMLPRKTAGIGGSVPYNPEVYSRAERTLRNCLTYLGNVLALREWYRYARPLTTGATPHGARCVTGGLRALDAIVEERTKRLGELAAKLRASAAYLRRDTDAAGDGSEAQLQERFATEWPRLAAALNAAPAQPDAPAERARDQFLEALDKTATRGDHVGAIRALSPEAKARGVAWLQAMVEWTNGLWI
jgi:UDP-N-acetylglucosamine/UDP-N-acetylgalactosamine diphosphorylase